MMILDFLLLRLMGLGLVFYMFDLVFLFVGVEKEMKFVGGLIFVFGAANVGASAVVSNLETGMFLNVLILVGCMVVFVFVGNLLFFILIFLLLGLLLMGVGVMVFCLIAAFIVVGVFVVL